VSAGFGRRQPLCPWRRGVASLSGCPAAFGHAAPWKGIAVIVRFSSLTDRRFPGFRRVVGVAMPGNLPTGRHRGGHRADTMDGDAEKAAAVEMKLRRAVAAFDWFVRVYASSFLRMANLEKQAQTLAEMPEIMSTEQSGLVYVRSKDISREMIRAS
jgi:hypothetical protein